MLGWGIGYRPAVVKAEVDRTGSAAGPGWFGGENDRPGKGAIGGIRVACFFRAADHADRVRFTIALGSGFRADVAQLVEHSLGKGEVTGSSPVISSRD
jgi:hypothetical protein